MAIPVKLIRRNIAGGTTPIHLDATEFRIAIERNVSAFALPFTTAYKFGLDFNLPTTVLNITGILQDDESKIQGETLPAGVIGTQGFYPTRSGSYNSDVMRDISSLYPTITFANDYTVGTTSVVVSGPIPGGLRLSDIFHPNHPTKSNKLYDTSGILLGTVAGVNSVTNTITLTSAGILIANVWTGTEIVTTNPDAYLHGRGFALQPELWRTGNPDKPAQIRGDTPVVYRFDGNTTSQYATGGSGVPTFVAGTEPETNKYPTISIPIGGIYSDTTIGGAAAGNPAKALTLSIKAAIDLSAALTSLEIVESGGRGSADAFDTVLSPNGYEVHITKTELDYYNINTPPLEMFSNNLFYNGSGTTDNWIDTRRGPAGQRWGFYVTLPYHSNLSSGSVQMGAKSAGDKAQDLLGIFANSPVGSDSEIVGIQVPYHSFVTSDTVDAKVRNFFLTYGSVASREKTSEGNELDASAPMDVDTGTGNDMTNMCFPEDADEDDDAGTLEYISSIGETIGDLLEDVYIVVDETRGGTGRNKGGIIIIPTKLNIRYDAGNRYYTYDMLLSAVNHKIAP